MALVSAVHHIDCLAGVKMVVIVVTMVVMVVISDLITTAEISVHFVLCSALGGMSLIAAVWQLH